VVLLPRLLVLTDRAGAASRGRSLVDTVAASIGAGATAVLFREKDLDAATRLALAAEVAAVVSAAGAAGARFGVASGFPSQVSSPESLLVDRAPATGWVHLAQRDVMPTSGDLQRFPPPGDLPAQSETHRADLLIGRSCHDVDEVRDAVAQGCDYVIVSPVAMTQSKPGYGPALGPSGLATLVEAASDLPVFALGGVTPDNTAIWRRCGAYGIAVMGGIMAAADPAEATTEYLEALGACQ
jgi:thiamine monophosphate synthase